VDEWRYYMPSRVSEREAVREQIADVFFGEDTCNDPDCDNCQATLDGLVDRVLYLTSVAR